MDKAYSSIYGLHIKQFVDLKTKLGFKYRTGSTILSQIDGLADKRAETSPGITKEFARAWGERRPQEAMTYRYTRIGYLAQLSSYLCNLGIPSYIPRLPRHRKSTFIPYIYSQKEIRELFKASDELRAAKRNMDSCLICMPALIRLLYATGIRKGEALALEDGDVDLEGKYLIVRDSKNGRQRTIPISESLASVCREYRNNRDQLPLGRTGSGHFFVKANGQKCGQGASLWFKKCLDMAAIPYKGRKHGPRLHDLRHTFAVTSLAGMAEAGIDLYASLPILSNYLGHRSIGATNHYVRLTANMYPGLINDMDTICMDVFPKTKNYEAD
jgi:integrase